MTLTIRLTPSEAARLEEAALEQGMDAAEFAHHLLANHLPPATAKTATNGQPEMTERDPELVARVRSIRGKYAHLGVTTEDLHRERQQEKTKEEGP